MSTARNADSTTHTGQRGWPAIATMVALLLGAGAALAVLVDLIVNLSAEKAEAPTMGVKFMRLAGDIGSTVPLLLIAATLVAVSRALAGADARRSTAALVVMATAAVVALLLLIAFLLSFGEVQGRSVAALGGGDEWATRIHLILGAIAAGAAAALANEARDRT